MTAPEPNDAKLDALDHHAGYCACGAMGWLTETNSGSATPDTELREAVRTVVQWVDNIAEWPMPPPLNEELRDLRAILERTER